MPKRILILQGHPDPSETHLCHALGDAYTMGAYEGGHSIDTLKIAEQKFPLLRMESDFNHGTPVDDIQQAQAKILQAEHLVIVYPLWLGAVPALVEGFFEQVFRPEFAFSYQENGPPIKRLKGKSAHVIVTMGMPALAYRWYFRAHSLKALERNLLNFCGVKPVRKSLFGGAKTASTSTRENWFARLQRDGKRGI